MLSDLRLIATLFTSLAVACTAPPRTAGPAPKTVAPTQRAPDATAEAANDVDASLVRSGYVVMRGHGRVFYCRNEIITGQRIGTRVCLTAAQIQNEKQAVSKAKDLLNQPGERCVKPMCVH